LSRSSQQNINVTNWRSTSSVTVKNHPPKSTNYEERITTHLCWGNWNARFVYTIRLNNLQSKYSENLK